MEKMAMTGAERQARYRLKKRLRDALSILNDPNAGIHDKQYLISVMIDYGAAPAVIIDFIQKKNHWIGNDSNTIASIVWSEYR